jgi:hypothetical protein
MTSAHKTHRAFSSRDRKLGMSWERTQLAEAKGKPQCEGRLDRLVMTASEMDETSILEIPGFRRGRNHFLRRKHPTDFLPYGRRTLYLTTGSISQVVVLSEPSIPHIAPRKVTLIARDEVGLQPTDVLSILELLPDAQFVLVELAFDFGSGSEVDGAFVRQHALFGKSRPNQVGVYHCWDSWGSRRGAKYVRSYFKPQLGVHRLELELHRKFLRRHGIKDIFDFNRLVEILPQRHILFAEINRSIVVRHLKNAGHDRYEVRQILERVSEHDDDLYAQCAVLRKRGRLKNVRRALVPLQTNRLIRKAIKKWAAQWPDEPRRLEGKRK